MPGFQRAFSVNTHSVLNLDLHPYLHLHLHMHMHL